MLHSFASVSSKSSSGSVISFVLENWNRGGGIGREGIIVSTELHNEDCRMVIPFCAWGCAKMMWLIWCCQSTFV